MERIINKKFSECSSSAQLTPAVVSRDRYKQGMAVAYI
jgi:hypothetical protein